MSANNRIYYASQAVLLNPQNSDGTQYYGGGTRSWLAPQGLQSVGMTTNFSLQQVFQLGQLDLYENVENVPEVEVTMNKTIDGTPPLYLICMGGSDGISGAKGQELGQLATNRVNFRLGIFPDNSIAATGNATHYVDCSGMYLSRVSYSFPVDGLGSEEISLVGNNKVWNSGLGSTQAFEIKEFLSGDGNITTKSATAPSIARRFSINTSGSVFPTGSTQGAATSGGIPIPSGRNVTRPYMNNIKISMDLGREAIYELGAMAPYFRYVKFPVEVTSEFEVTASDGDYVNANDFNGQTGSSFKNLKDYPIKVVVDGSGTSDKLIIDLGAKNKLTSVNYNGGGTDGGNASITYSYQTFNKFIVDASGTFIGSSWIDNTNDSDNWL